MKSMNDELKKVMNRVKDAQSQLQTLIKNQDWVDEAKKYAERQGKEMKKLFAPDVVKVKSFLERERKELERFQKQIPDEVKKLRKFVAVQKKEFERLLNNMSKMNKKSASGRGAKKATAKKSAKKSASKTAATKTSTKKKASSTASTSESNT